MADSDDHDPWNNPDQRHPRAREVMPEELWDCVDEDAPFGSDEGADAYAEYRAWREENPGAPLMHCITWIGDESGYADPFTYDATIIATVLGQLVDEGRVDADVKPLAHNAIRRQMKGAESSRVAILKLIQATIEVA